MKKSNIFQLKKFNYLIVVVLIFFYSQSSMSACNNTGYTVLKSDTGVEMCGKGSTIVQTIDLTQGAGIKSLYKEPSLDAYNVELFDTQSTDGFTLKSFSIVNGTFFDSCCYSYSTPSKLAFILKEHNKTITNGYKKSLILGIFGQSARIIADTGDYTAFTQVIGGHNLTELSTRPLNPERRNMVGTNGSKIYILITTSMTVANADKLIRAFGATQTMQLDGSGSVRLKSDVTSGNISSSDGRYIPHAIAVLSKKQQDIAVNIDKCITKYPSYFGAKLGSLHSDCGSGSIANQLYCQSTSAGQTDQAKGRKIGISFQPNTTLFWHYSNLYLWRGSLLTSCN